MNTSTSTNSKPSDVFRTYPQFSKLTFADRKKYEALVHSYPPLSDLTFSTLMNWWNALDACAVSTLNGNLIISYWVAGMEKMSGISLIGTEQIDETVCSVFDELRTKGESPRLVHVSEFVIERMRHPELFRFTPEPEHDEYILDVTKYSPLNRLAGFRRSRIQKFLKHVDSYGTEAAVRTIDLGIEKCRQLLLAYAGAWAGRGRLNPQVKYMRDSLAVAIGKADLLGTEALGLFVGDELQAFIVYTPQATDKQYVVLSHMAASYEIPHTSEYLLYAFAQWFSDRGVRYVNIDADLGVPSLRNLKLSLGPVNYFRKYTIEPAYG